MSNNRKTIKSTAKPDHSPGSPDQTHQKVDFATVLNRRRRSAQEYVHEKKLKTLKGLTAHLKMLEKTYMISPEFRAACKEGMTCKMTPAFEEAFKKRTGRGPTQAPKKQERTARKRG